MNKQSFILFLLIFFSTKILAQNPIADTTRIFKEYKKIIPKMECDSARVSPNGKYALVLKGNSLGDCYINYWNLYENGLNKTITENIVILKDTAYFVTYENEGVVDRLTYFQNDELFSWKLVKKCPLKVFLKEYNLSKTPKNRTKNLTVTIDRLPDFKVKIPWELWKNKVGDSLESTAQRIELKFIYKDKILHTIPIKYLANPSEKNTPEGSFEIYLSEIQKQLKQSNFLFWPELYGSLFLESNNIFYLRCEILTLFFSGYTHFNFVVKENGIEKVHTNWNSTYGDDQNSRFILLNKTE